ncbi:MAG TPA: glycosyltransferase family 4 protein [Gemmatimonadaceae bacterium]|nr:glycosyltransferase family 4 protein [Gemmatimonadaceae bacterium]
MNRLRVLHLDAGRTWRGGQRQVLLLALGLRDRGHEPFLIGAAESPLVQRARAAGLAVAAMTMRADWDIRAARKIRARMRAWNVDMVHAHDARSHALAMLALIGRPEIPLIVTRRVPFPPKSVRLKYGERVTRFIAISKAVREAMVSGGIDARRISVVHSGIAPRPEAVTPRDWRAELGWPADSVVCGVVGAMTPEKGVDSLAAIGAALPVEVQRITRLVLIGPEPGDAPGLGGLTGHSAGFQEDVDSAIAGLDMLWHPARAEGLGTSVIDAMSLGVPPIAFAVGGIPEVIEDGVSGLLITPGDTTAFAAGAATLIATPPLRERLGAGARLRAKAFDAGQMTMRTETVYQDVLSG